MKWGARGGQGRQIGLLRCVVLVVAAYKMFPCGFYRAKRSGARYCHDTCKLSVCLSVTLVDCDHMRWNSSKIISRIISLGT